MRFVPKLKRTVKRKAVDYNYNFGGSHIGGSSAIAFGPRLLVLLLYSNVINPNLLKDLDFTVTI